VVKYASRFNELREAARKAGLRDPYLVYMGWSPERDWAVAQELGFDAISAYALGGDGGGPYQALVADVENVQWDFCSRHEIPFVPLVQTGWDKRPRMDNPVPWERDASYHKARKYYETATPGEITAHLGRALDWAEQHPAPCAAKVVIMYGWNEHDEGGWLVPTWSADGTPNTERLDAVKRALNRDRSKE